MQTLEIKDGHYVNGVWKSGWERDIAGSVKRRWQIKWNVAQPAIRSINDSGCRSVGGDCIAFLQLRCRNWNATNEEAFRCVFHMREEDQGLLIERLEKTNYEFERLAAAYDEVNRQI